jgi:ATP-dependent Clp protease ATP-binding subunit ClpX
MTKTTDYCGFCGKSRQEVEHLIEGPITHVCNECVELMNEILRAKNENRRTRDRAE